LEMNAPNGCEVDTTTTLEHCGMCDKVCPDLDNATTKCEASDCVIDKCTAGFASCDTKDSSGCETDVTSNPAHCGQCNKLCGSSTPYCIQGKCLPLPATCTIVAGVKWCTHPTKCGKACNDTCSAVGLTPMADQTKWLEAQNTNAKCQVLMNAFGLKDYSVGAYTYACMEDGGGPYNNGPVPQGKLLCSTQPNCPNKHLTMMDGIDQDCSSNSSRVSICPCE